MPASRGQLAFEVMLVVFHVSFLYAFLSFTFEARALPTGACWLLTAIVTYVYILAVRARRGAWTPCLTLSTFESASWGVQVGFKYLAISMCAIALAAMSIALFQHEGLVETSWWMTMIASLMAAKWSLLLHQLITAIQVEAFSAAQAPLIHAVGEIA